MKWILNFPIRLQILSVALAALVSFAVTLGANYLVTQHNTALLKDIEKVSLPVVDEADKALGTLLMVKEAFVGAVTTADKDLKKEAQARADDMKKTLSDMAVINPDLGVDINRLNDLFVTYYEIGISVTDAVLRRIADLAALKPAVDRMDESYEGIATELKRFREQSYKTAIVTINKANQASENALKLQLVIGAVSVLILVFISTFISKMITDNIRGVLGSLREMASGEGDLTQRLTSNGKDEIAELVKAFNEFVGKLQTIIRELVGSTAQLTGAAQEMKAIADTADRGIKRQQAEVEQVATSMNQMVTTVQEVAKNAVRAQSAAEEASEEGEGGRLIVAGTVSSIERLACEVNNAAEVINRLENDSSNVGAVLDVIRGIAEQTNLLALNAAIEAARAGEYGRGFAVVADEVRTLAQRTHDSTREIQEVIERLQAGAGQAVKTMNQGVTQAKESVTQVTKAGSSFESIVDRIDTITSMNTQIANASEEQEAVAEEINRNIVSIHEVSTDTADGVRQSAASSEQLSKFAEQVQVLVGQFKV